MGAARWCAGAILAVSSVILAGCGGPETAGTVVIGSTTSLYDTGLLDTLVAAFEDDHPDINTRVLSVGTGQALALGRRGDADVLLVHAPPAELEFMRGGHGRSRITFMRNDFVLAGPASDPVGLRDLADEDRGPTGLRAIAGAGAPFVSRGDDSGTHMREKAIWEAAGIEPAGEWYVEAGQGMGATLMLASERQAYVLTDRSTYTVLGDVLDLEILTTGGPLLENLYSVLETTAGVNPEGARRFRDWLLGERALSIVRTYGEAKYGQPLFTLVPFDLEASETRTGSRLTLNPFREAWTLLTSADTYVWEVVFRSLTISGMALVLATLIGLPLGVLLALSRFRLRTPVVALVNTGLAFPPVVVGLAVYLLLSRSGPAGFLGLLYTPSAIVLAQIILAGPYIAAVTLAALEGVPPDVRQQARGIGASPWQATLLHLREARASLIAAVAAGFGAVISEVGAVMIVGGNLLGETRVMTTAIVLETRKGNFGVAIALGIVLLAIAFVINLGLTVAHGRGLRRPVFA
jgi:ABC-type tungstate transport system permease subunit/ABC-type tungstate transport system substrate-binding protein